MKRQEVIRSIAWVGLLLACLTGWVAHEQAIQCRDNQILLLQQLQWRQDSAQAIDHPKAQAWDSMQAKCARWSDLLGRLSNNTDTTKTYKPYAPIH